MDANPPLVLVEDQDLLDEVLRLGAAVGCDLERVPDAAAARQRWTTAPLVVLDPAAVTQCAQAELARRSGVVVVCREQPPEQVWKSAVSVGVENVLTPPATESWLGAALRDVAEGPSRGDGRVVAVLGGRGGAGASVFASALAVVALSRGGTEVMLVDCDPLGGGLDLVLGAETVAGLRWPGLELREGRIAGSALRSALPAPEVGNGALSVLSCDREGPGPERLAAAAVIDAGRRRGETVVCDLPRYLTEPGFAVLDRADLAVMVVPAEVRACAAAARVAEQVAGRGTPLRLVVRGPSPGGLDAEHLAHALGLPVLATMRPEPGLEAALERGQAPARHRGHLASAAHTVLDALDALVLNGKPA